MNLKNLALISLLVAPACATSDEFGADDLGAEEVSSDEQEIVGGSPEKIKDSPWQVSIFDKEFTGHVCGGSIIDATHVLTARHCLSGLPDGATSLSPKFFAVAAGISKLSKIGVEGQVVDIDDVVPLADGYDGIQPNGKDIVLLRLAKPLHFNSKVQPIQLATPADEVAGRLKPGVKATVTGFGRTAFDGPLSDQLLSVDLPIVKLQVAEAELGLPISSDLLAAGGVAGKDSCAGDSGGPLVVKKGNKYILAGVVSFGIRGCGEPGLPGLYTRVARFHDVIQEALCEDQKVIKKKDHIAGARDEMKFIEVHVPAGQRQVNFNVFGGSGDADLFVKKGARPTADSFDCKSGVPDSNNETCNFGSPAPGTYWVGLLGFADYADVKLRVNGYSEGYY